MYRNARFARLRVVIASSLIFGAAGMAAASPAQAVTLYSANLAGAQVVPGPGDPDAVGFVDLSFGIDPEQPNRGRICAAWDITDLDPAGASAEIGLGQLGEAGATFAAVTPPDPEGPATDCLSDLDLPTVQAIVDDPTGFFVQVRNDEFPDGAIRGQIQFTQIVAVSVREFVCPGSVRTAADALPAPEGTCTVAARTGDLPAVPLPGYTWSQKPTLFDMRVNLTTDDGVLTLDDADREGGYTCGPAKTCTVYSEPYAWRDLAPGPMTVTALTAPRGYKFGWATIGPSLEGETAPTGTVNVGQHSVSFDMTHFGSNDGVLISIYNFRGH
jgi:hypothetical protein